MTTALPSIETPYLTLERPVLVYQRHGGLIAAPFDLDGAPHVVTVRIDPLTDAETVAIIPACAHDPRATLAALVEALDALEGVRDRAQAQGRRDAVRLFERAAQAQGRRDAVRLFERALVALRREGQTLAETRAQPASRVTAYPDRRTPRHTSRMEAYA